MLDRSVREKIDGWASEFGLSDRLGTFAPEVREAAPFLLAEFLAGACGRAAGAPEDIEESHLRGALLEDLARYHLSERVARDVPALAAEFLAALQDEGRLAGGRALGAFVRALAPAWVSAAIRSAPFTRAGTKVDRNAPCPCGSGLKYKKCCLGRLDRP